MQVGGGAGFAVTEAPQFEVALPQVAWAQLVAEVKREVLAELGESRAEGHWLTGAKACAHYLGCSPRRVYARLPEIPHVKDEGRLMFNTADLDAWLRGS